MNTIAIDLGGSRIKTGYFCDGVLKKTDVMDVKPGVTIAQALEDVFVRICETLDAKELSGIEKVGYAYPGLVNFAEKRAASASGKYEDAPGFDFGAWTRRRFGCDYIIENDANAALVGEISGGCAKGQTDAVMMILGTGVGAAAVMNGRLVRGKHFQAGCLGGHFPTELDGRKCSCGGRGCVEANCGTWVLDKLIREHPGFEGSPMKSENSYSFRVLEKYLDEGDPVARDVFGHCVRAWSNCVISLIYAYDPDTVVLSGGVMNMGDKILTPLMENVENRVWTPWGSVRFLVSDEPERSVLAGLDCLAREAE